MGDALLGAGFPAGYEARLRTVYLKVLLLGALFTSASGHFEWHRNIISSRVLLLQAVVLWISWFALLLTRHQTLRILRLTLHVTFGTQTAGLLAAYLLHVHGSAFSPSPMHLEKSLFAFTIMLFCTHTIHGPRDAWLVAIGMCATCVLAVAGGVLYLMSVGALDEAMAAQSLRVALGGAIALGISRVFADLYAFQLRNEGRRRLLESQVNSDPVTQLGNRRWFEQVLEREHAVAERNRQPVSLMIIDVDSFKMVNDSYGHSTGDDVLYLVSEVLSGAIRSSDCVARWGGDEFAVILPATKLDEARIVAEGMREAVLAASFPIKDVSISVGVAELEYMEPADSLIERADRALYVAKRKGKNRVQVDHQEDTKGPRPGSLLGVEDPTTQLS